MTTAAAPELRTARLRLRAHRANDLDASLAMWSDAGVVRFIGGKPFTRAEVWARLLRYAGMWSLLGYGFWAVEDRACGEFLGEVGFMDARRDIDPPITDPEAGWVFLQRAHGRGIASEALTAALDWADSNLACVSTVAMIEDGNAASVAVARKFGFRVYATTTYAGSPVELFRRQKKAAAGFANT